MEADIRQLCVAKTSQRFSRGVAASPEPDGQVNLVHKMNDPVQRDGAKGHRVVGMKYSHGRNPLSRDVFSAALRPAGR